MMMQQQQHKALGARSTSTRARAIPQLARSTVPLAARSLSSKANVAPCKALPALPALAARSAPRAPKLVCHASASGSAAAAPKPFKW